MVDVADGGELRSADVTLALNVASVLCIPHCTTAWLLDKQAVPQSTDYLGHMSSERNK